VIRPWKKVSSAPAADLRIFKARWDRKVSPRTGQDHDFVVLESLDWVNVIALTPNQELVMVEQYRHGSDTVELEIPGGLLDDSLESPIEAGLRELREETGYEGSDAIILSEQLPNPAFLNNRCHTVLVRDCVNRHPLEWDHGEDLETRLVPVQDIPALIASGAIRHSIIIAALYAFELWSRNQNLKPHGPVAS
jgi:ADP-ribose pyrophosphatase